MSEAAAISNAPVEPAIAVKPPVSFQRYLLGVLGLALGLALLAWCCSPRTVPGHGSRNFTQELDQDLAPVQPSPATQAFDVATAASLGAATLGVVLVGLVLWRLSWARRMRALEEQWRVKRATLELQLNSGRKLEERLRAAEEWKERAAVLKESEAKVRAQMADLAEQKARLESELDQRKRIEQNLSQQRQVLESSRTVLELHVQARTVELQQLKHRYELLLNSAGEGICGLDLEGRVTFVNPAVEQLTGWSVEELTGKTEQEFLAAQQPEGQASPAQANSGERMFRRKDGGVFPAEFVRTRIEEDGRQTGSVLMFKDVTERRRAEEDLAQKAAELGRSNAELEQFAFVASHDLQEPLRKIQAFGDRLKLKCENLLPADALDYLQRMQSASARMRTLIDDLLAFSRVIRRSEPFVQVDLGQITREVLGDLEVRLERTGGQVEVGELPALEADPTHMRQLLLNLIGNALKFQAPGNKPVVKVSGRKFTSGSGEEFCELTVQDNGIGFDEQYAEKIFAVFQRLHGRGEYEGTGIGLAVCRRITDRHQGTIVARSQPGKGASFIVTLPLRQTRSQAAA